MEVCTFVPIFIKSPLLPTPASCNHKSGSFSMCSLFKMIFDLQYYFSPSTQHNDISMHFKMIIRLSLFTTCFWTEILNYYWPYSPLCTFHSHDPVICNWKSVPLTLPHIFLAPPYYPAFWRLPVCSLYLGVCCCFVASSFICSVL